MDIKENYVITSGNQPSSSFVSDFTYPVRLEHGHKIAVKSIFYGPKVNINDKNHKLWLRFEKQTKMPEHIENGWYESIHDLAKEVLKKSNEMIETWNNAKEKNYKFTTMEYDGDTITFNLDEHVEIMVDPTHTDNNIMYYMDVDTGYYNKLELKNKFFSSCYPAFLYSNVIENSFIDNHASRHLSMLPLQSGYTDGKTGYHYHEFSNPTYYNFGVSEFSDIIFQIRDIDGDLIDFSEGYKTIITLEVFKPVHIVQ